MKTGFAVLTLLGTKISTKEVGYAKRETTCDGRSSIRIWHRWATIHCSYIIKTRHIPMLVLSHEDELQILKWRRYKCCGGDDSNTAKADLHVLELLPFLLFFFFFFFFFRCMLGFLMNLVQIDSFSSIKMPNIWRRVSKSQFWDVAVGAVFQHIYENIIRTATSSYVCVQSTCLLIGGTLSLPVRIACVPDE